MANNDCRNTVVSDFVTNGNDNAYQDIVSKLTFISKFKNGYKIDIKSLTLMEDSIYTMLYRTFIARGESKEVTLEFCKSAISSAFGTSISYLQSDEPFIREMGMTIIKAIQDSMEGINVLKKTYVSDYMFVSRIDTLLKTIKIRLDSMIIPKGKCAEIYI